MSPIFRLQPLGREHAEGYVALLADAGTAPYISDRGVLERDAALAQLQAIGARNVAGSAQVYQAIVDGVSGEFLGYVAAHDLHGATCPISYAILPSQRRRGIATVALRLLLDHLRQHAAAEWIEARTHADNRSSQALLRASGFVHVAHASPATGQREVFRRRNR
ncbi:MAG: GNAT family N-acetyltransferase [Verrucomicrobia bacterium]|nr:GNAT family N-acetyltransferase [Verrucomicrobiota bacterium]